MGLLLNVVSVAFGIVILFVLALFGIGFLLSLLSVGLGNTFRSKFSSGSSRRRRRLF